MARSKPRVTIDFGGGVMALLGAILVLGKVLGWGSLATAPWWAVTMPFWIGLAVVLFLFAVFVIVGLVFLFCGAGFFGAVEWWDARSRRNHYKGIR